MTPLSAQEAEALFGRILDGALPDAEVAGLLSTLADRGETADEIVGAARAMRARMVAITAPPGAIDVCGTGGDGQHSLNVSTAVALVTAACGVPVAKHGNRAASSKCGGADVLEALGLNLEQASQRAADSLDDLGLAFLFAPLHHPALARLAPIRRALGRKTIFNLLGPLVNPAHVSRQLIGVASPALLPRYADAVAGLGVAQALIVSGDEGLDEVSIAGPTSVRAVGLAFPAPAITPQDAGLACHPLATLAGGDAAHNAQALRRLLMSAQDTPADRAYRDTVLLNTAAALLVAGEVQTLADGVEEAREAIDKGLAKTLLDCWISFCA